MIEICSHQFRVYVTGPPSDLQISRLASNFQFASYLFVLYCRKSKEIYLKKLDLIKSQGKQSRVASQQISRTSAVNCKKTSRLKTWLIKNSYVEKSNSKSARIQIKRRSVKKSSTPSHLRILSFNPPLPVVPSPHRINSSSLRKIRAYRFILLMYFQTSS